MATTFNVASPRPSPSEENIIVKPYATSFHSILNLVNVSIGAGVLGLPFAFAKAGLIPSLSIFCCVSVICYISLTYLSYVCDAILVYSYGEVWSHFFHIFFFDLQRFFLVRWSNIWSYWRRLCWIFHVSPLLWSVLGVYCSQRRLFDWTF